MAAKYFDADLIDKECFL